jgi:hypothetical protein
VTRPDLLCGRLLPSPASTSPPGSRDPVIQIRQTSWGLPWEYTQGHSRVKGQNSRLGSVIWIIFLSDRRHCPEAA